jgi:Zn-dependent M28 family amino/carboxypeptidase
VKPSEDRYPAADDNASSVVNGLELARVFSSRSFGRTIVLFFSTGEEQGARGVREYLAQLSPDELAAIKYVINRDVTGYDANGDEVMELVHGGHPPSQALAQVMSATIDAYELNLDQRMIVGCP